MQSLDLSNNQLTGPIPTNLGSLFEVRHIILSNNQLSGAIPTNLSNLVNLIRLDLSNNQLGGNIPVELCYIEYETGAQNFADFGYNKLSAADPCIDVLDNDWAQTQTVPPTNVNARLVGQQVQLQWCHWPVLEKPQPSFDCSRPTSPFD